MLTKSEKVQRHLEQTLKPFWLADWREYLSRSTLQDLQDENPRHSFIRSIFYPSDRIWMGGMYDSGEIKHEANFKPVHDWLDIERLPSRCAAGVFKKGSFQRSMSNVIRSPFVVIECDDLIGFKPTTERQKESNKAASFAMAQYLRVKWDMNLRAVIDTGNKSLHLWFDRPSDHTMGCIDHMAESHRIDATILSRCQASPLRMPGCIHEKTRKPAELLYLKSYSQCTSRN